MASFTRAVNVVNCPAAGRGAGARGCADLPQPLRIPTPPRPLTSVAAAWDPLPCSFCAFGCREPPREAGMMPAWGGAARLCLGCGFSASWLLGLPIPWQRAPPPEKGPGRPAPWWMGPCETRTRNH